MTDESIAFWCLTAVLVGSALAVVLSKNLFHSVLWLALALTGTAGIFLLLEAEFIAAVQLLLYAGGVITIAVFAIVVTERLVGQRRSDTNRNVGAAAMVCVAIFAGLYNTVDGQPPTAMRLTMPHDVTKALGDMLLTQFVLPFELLALVLLVALLSAIYFARPED